MTHDLRPDRCLWCDEPLEEGEVDFCSDQCFARWQADQDHEAAVSSFLEERDHADPD